MTKTIDRYIKEFEKVKEVTAKEPSWLGSVRQEALDSFAQKGFPTVKDEEWRYTDLSDLTKSRFSVKSAPFRLASKDIESLKASLNGHFLFFINGLFRAEISNIPEGVRVRELMQAVAEERALQEPLRGMFPASGNIFSDINVALGLSGQWIEIPAGLKLEKPIFLIHYTDADGILCQPKTFVRVGSGAQVALIEDYRGIDWKKYLTNAFVGVALEENATCSYYKLQQESSQAFHIGNLKIKQGPKSFFSSLSITLGSRLMRQEISIELSEEAACNLSGICLGDKGQHFDQVTWIDHAQPAAKSDQLFKGILSGDAHGVFTGRVLVRQGAQKTEAHQTNRNLLLSEKAKADSRPQLEILADDVKCSHGAATGQLESDALFYLRSRGMSEQLAQKILSEGFAREITDAIKDESFKSYVEKRVSEKLANLGVGK